MDFALTEEQRAIQDGIDQVLSDFGDEYWLEKDRNGGFPEEFAGGDQIGLSTPAIAKARGEVILRVQLTLLDGLAKPTNRLSFIRLHSDAIGETIAHKILRKGIAALGHLEHPAKRLRDVGFHPFALEQMKRQIAL